MGEKKIEGMTDDEMLEHNSQIEERFSSLFERLARGKGLSEEDRKEAHDILGLSLAIEGEAERRLEEASRLLLQEFFGVDTSRLH